MKPIRSRCPLVNQTKNRWKEINPLISQKVVPQFLKLVYTLWLFNIAMENGPFIVGLPIKNGDFPWLC